MRSDWTVRGHSPTSGPVRAHFIDRTMADQEVAPVHQLQLEREAELLVRWQALPRLGLDQRKKLVQ